MKVPVTARALVQRINRKLAAQDGPLGRTVKKARGQQTSLNIGEYFILDLKGNFVLQKDIDLQVLGRRLKVLKPWEEMES